MKHVTLIKIFGGQDSAAWRLIGHDGETIRAFDLFQSAVLKRHPLNTRKAYALAFLPCCTSLWNPHVELGRQSLTLRRPEFLRPFCLG